MLKKIHKRDMEALAELIREKGCRVTKLKQKRFPNFPYLVEFGENQVLVGHDEGFFVATGKIPGFPMTNHGYGGVPYRFAI